MTLLLVLVLVFGFLMYWTLSSLNPTKARKSILFRVAGAVLLALLYLGYKIYKDFNTVPEGATYIERDTKK